MFKVWGSGQILDFNVDYIANLLLNLTMKEEF